MRNERKIRALLLGAVIFGLGPVAAGAQDCVKVIGTEPGVPNLTMDPAFVNLADDSYQQNAVYNRLVNLDSSFQPIPELAKSWNVSEDGLTWTFELEEGVTFHDGRPMTAKDVVYSFRRLLDPKVGSPAAAVLNFLDADGITAIDDHTVAFKTPTVVADLPTVLAIKYGLVVPEGSTSEELKLKAVGTGPFVQDVYSPTETRRVFQRNNNYWRKGLPKAQCLELSVVTEEVSRIAAIRSGAADLILSAGAAAAGVLANDPTLKLEKSAPGTYLTLSMWTDTPPFNDVRVRQALKKVVDRQLLVDTIILGNGVAGNDNPVPPTSPLAYTSEIKPQDIAGAKKLLAEAGHPNGLTIELNTGEGYPGMVALAQAFQQMAAQAGITVNVINNPADSYWDVIWMKKPFFTSNWSGRPPAEGLPYTFTSDAKYNEAKWNNPEFDRLLKEARSETDVEKRNALYKEAQKLLSDDGGVIIPYFVSDVAVMRADCEGYVPHPQVPILNYENFVCKGKEAAQ
ncbi:ABC transporter substrate-binding protein [Rhodoligotrophos defluvii]|uniref:ABC transporter substrate-binding protein n=1 Tax=Rhodoligotrophos defluvii TaxID=2561934 RepID=UPI001485A84C|nr:ABC transporter substrate-binding protein [Rhodoligotrophos defluvii]